MKTLRKTILALSFFVFLGVAGISAASEAPDGSYIVTVSEAPTTQYEISPTSTRWKVQSGGRLIPISASRVKYMRVATFHGAPGQYPAAPSSESAQSSAPTQQIHIYLSPAQYPTSLPNYAPTPGYPPVPVNQYRQYAPTPGYPQGQSGAPDPNHSPAPYSLPAPQNVPAPYSLTPGDSYPPTAGQ
ncbi:MAG: hypothetical protein LBT31_09900 [Synergistaceae bacterium]|jgi:hypothetical protein|nr:hypothetical protein [Synergistaceae bacterium]